RAHVLPPCTPAAQAAPVSATVRGQDDAGRRAALRAAVRQWRVAATTLDSAVGRARQRPGRHAGVFAVRQPHPPGPGGQRAGAAEALGGGPTPDSDVRKGNSATQPRAIGSARTTAVLRAAASADRPIRRTVMHRIPVALLLVSALLCAPLAAAQSDGSAWTRDGLEQITVKGLDAAF